MKTPVDYDKCRAAIAALLVAQHQLREAGLWATYQLIDAAVKRVGFEVQELADKKIRPAKRQRRKK